MARQLSAMGERSAQGWLILGQRYRAKLEAPLRALGFECLWLPDNPDVDPRLAAHTDLSVFYDKKNTIFFAPYLADSSIVSVIQEAGLRTVICQIKQGAYYPKDVQMNICLLHSHFIFSEKASAVEISKHLKQQGQTALGCKQGYAACSVCTVDDKSLITADLGIARVCRDAGLDVLCVECGHVKLDGFPYGFLGGAAFKASSPNLLYFTGHFENHADCEKIKRFLAERSIKAVLLTDEPVFDIGGAVYIKNKRLD